MTEEPIDLGTALTPLVKQKQQEAQELIDRVVSIQIDSVEGRDSVAIDLTTLKGHQKEWEKLRKTAVDPLNKRVKNINDFFRGPADSMAACEKALKRVISDFDDRVAEEARKAAEAEANRIAAAAERKAKSAETRGDEDAAEELRQRAETETAIVKATAAVAPAGKVKGVSSSTVYDFVIVDKMALIQAVAAGHQPASLLEVNETVIRKMVNALKEDFTMPGIQVTTKKVMRASAS